jgi:hypothetical protein
MSLYPLILIIAYSLVVSAVYASEEKLEYWSIDDMDDATKWRIVTDGGVKLSVVADSTYVKEGAKALRLEYSGETKCRGCYGGIHFYRTDFYDWKRYDGITFWVYNPENIEVEVEIKFNERTSDDRLSKYRVSRYIRTKGWHKIEAPFKDFSWMRDSDIKYPFDLSNFYLFRINFRSATHSFTVYLDDLKLYRDATKKIPETSIVLFDETHGAWFSISKEKAKELYQKWPYGDSSGRSPDDYDYSGLVSILESLNLKPKRVVDGSINYDLLRKSAILTIFASEKPFSMEEKEAIYEYVENGGSLLIGEAWASGTRTLLSQFGIGLGFFPLRQLSAPEIQYKTLPIQDHPLTKRVTVLMISPHPITYCEDCVVLLKTPNETFVDENNNLQYDVGEPIGSFPVMVYKKIGDGKILVISQSYIFQTRNLDYNGQLFAKKVFSWLAGLPMPEKEELPVVPVSEESREFESVQKRAFFGPTIDEALPELLTNQQFLMIAPLILGFLTLLIQLFRGS